MDDLKLLKAITLIASWEDKHFICLFCKRSLVGNFHSDDCLLIEARNRELINQDDLLASGDFGDEGIGLTKWGRAARKRWDAERSE